MSSVEIERIGAVARLRLNEPESMNALSDGIAEGLTKGVAASLADPEVRCLMITGTGRAFCAGGDIRTMDDRQPVAVRSMMQHHHHGWVMQLLTAEKPIVTAVNGIAAGAGFAIALLGDVVLASSDAKFRSAFLGLGAVPDMGLAYTLPRAVGFQRASEIILTNRFVDAEEASRLGLVARVIAADTFADEALEVAKALAAAPTVSVGIAKSLLRRSYDGSLEQFFQSEAYAQAIAFNTEDFAEGVAAFRAKRPAAFQGR